MLVGLIWSVISQESRQITVPTDLQKYNMKMRESSLRCVSTVTAQAKKQSTCGYNWFLFIKLKVTEFLFNKGDL